MVLKRFYISLIFLSVVLILYLLASYLIASKLVQPFERRLDISPKLISDNYENISVEATDGVILKGWFFNADSPDENDKLIILVTGATQNRINTGYYSVLITRELLSQNYNVIMYDNRATGESGGSNTTFGILESQDIIKVVEFAKQKGFKEENIAIIGNSLGGISLLLSAEKLNGIGAMVVDSAAATLEPSIKQILQAENNVPAILNPGIFFILKEVYGINVADVRPINHVAKVPNRTFLFLHGGKDTTIPVENSEKLLRASNSKSKLVIFEDGYHIETFKTDPKKYLNEVSQFLEDELNTQ